MVTNKQYAQWLKDTGLLDEVMQVGGDFFGRTAKYEEDKYADDPTSNKAEIEDRRLRDFNREQFDAAQYYETNKDIGTSPLFVSFFPEFRDNIPVTIRNTTPVKEIKYGLGATPDAPLYAIGGHGIYDMSKKISSKGIIIGEKNDSRTKTTREYFHYHKVSSTEGSKEFERFKRVYDRRGRFIKAIEKKIQSLIRLIQTTNTDHLGEIKELNSLQERIKFRRESMKKVMDMMNNFQLFTGKHLLLSKPQKDRLSLGTKTSYTWGRDINGRKSRVPYTARVNKIYSGHQSKLPYTYRLDIGILDPARMHIGFAGQSSIQVGDLIKILASKGFDVLAPLRNMEVRKKIELEIGRIIIEGINKNTDARSTYRVGAKIKSLGKKLVLLVRDFLQGGTKPHIAYSTYNTRKSRKKINSEMYKYGMLNALWETGQLEKSIEFRVVPTRIDKFSKQTKIKVDKLPWGQKRERFIYAKFLSYHSARGIESARRADQYARTHQPQTAFFRRQLDKHYNDLKAAISETFSDSIGKIDADSLKKLRLGITIGPQSSEITRNRAIQAGLVSQRGDRLYSRQFKLQKEAKRESQVRTEMKGIMQLYKDLLSSDDETASSAARTISSRYDHSIEMLNQEHERELYFDIGGKPRIARITSEVWKRDHPGFAKENVRSAYPTFLNYERISKFMKDHPKMFQNVDRTKYIFRYLMVKDARLNPDKYKKLMAEQNIRGDDIIFYAKHANEGIGESLFRTAASILMTQGVIDNKFKRRVGKEYRW